MYVSICYLDVLYDKLMIIDKVVYIYSFGKECVEDCMEMVCIVGGFSYEDFEKKVYIYININLILLLKYDEFMMDGWIRLVKCG